jgi:hypothetical protein
LWKLSIITPVPKKGERAQVDRGSRTEPYHVERATLDRSYTRAVAAAPQQSDLARIAQHLFALMLRNVASDGFVFSDPANPGVFSRPGCVTAFPSYLEDLTVVNQNYVFNWTRDAAITTIELSRPTRRPLTIRTAMS